MEKEENEIPPLVPLKPKRLAKRRKRQQENEEEEEKIMEKGTKEEESTVAVPQGVPITTTAPSRSLSSFFAEVGVENADKTLRRFKKPRTVN